MRDKRDIILDFHGSPDAILNALHQGGWAIVPKEEVLRPGGPSHPDKKTISIDFDGVLHGYSLGWNGGEIYDPPISGAQEAVRELAKTWTLKISTCRQDRPAIWSWLERYGMDEYIAEVTNEKPVATVYIDDRAVRFRGDWRETLDTVASVTADAPSAINGPGC